MDIKGYCSQCEREFLTKHLVPLIDDLIKNKSAFREAFENKNPKFCRSCKRKWLELGKLLHGINSVIKFQRVRIFRFELWECFIPFPEKGVL